MAEIHGCTDRPEFRVWVEMRRRCRATHRHNSHNYSGRGIKVCRAWDESFMAFFADVGRRPSASHSIDRIDGCKNYEPGNVRWATKLEQSQNARTVWLRTSAGERIGVKEAARRLAIPPYVLYRYYTNRRNAARRARGACPDCGSPTLDRVRCQRCLSRRAAQMRRYRTRRISVGGR